MINQVEIEVNKIYAKIDKIAKKGNDSFLEYFIYVDTLIKDGKYGYFKECLEVKYQIVDFDSDVQTLKRNSWKEILFQTHTNFQEFTKKLLKSKGIVQNGLYYFKDIQPTRVKVLDNNGSGCELVPNIVDDYVSSITVLKTGSAYSGSASVIITGGVATASATPVVRGGKIYSVTITATGSGHNKLLKLGKITETDEYNADISNKLTKDLYQRLIKNKSTYLTATKEGLTYSATFSTWDVNYTYDKNLSNLYTSAINYLLS
jgi:hypothetical protein